MVVGDGVNSGFLAALDRETGALRWRTARKTITQYGNYGTPVVATLAGKPQLIVHGGRLVTSYDPSSGELIWQSDGPCEVSACTVAFDDRLVFASGGFPEREVLAIRADGKGDVSRTHVVWRTRDGMTYVPSPLYHDGLLYAVNDQGIASCWEAATGKELWGHKRVGGAFSGSPVLAGGFLFSTSERGTTYVFRAGRSYEKVAENTLGEPALTTPAVAGGQLFLRTETKLYCIGNVQTAGR
jgi:outer membrane protein assembly factor BamB